jgi:hypothetical protein
MSFLDSLFKKKEPPHGHSITVHQGVAANALSIQALINVLVNKKICTREELLNELKNISDENRQHVQAPK